MNTEKRIKELEEELRVLKLEKKVEELKKEIRRLQDCNKQPYVYPWTVTYKCTSKDTGKPIGNLDYGHSTTGLVKEYW